MTRNYHYVHNPQKHNNKRAKYLSSIGVRYTSVPGPFQVRCKSVPKNGRKMGEKWDLHRTCKGITWDLGKAQPAVIWSFGQNDFELSKFSTIYKYLYIVSK